ncbi:MAG: DUF1385 domain-containing protein [Chitinispirillaceae bacterium]|nr:DUF1385 domain-containing protein [Chitinispirillaceae bacterium]
MNVKNLLLPAALLPRVADLFAKPKKAGGQAVIEGVMMRCGPNVSWAVRDPKGALVVERFPFVSAASKGRFWRLPVMRGAVNLYESLVIGFKALSRSAEIASEEDRAGKKGAAGPEKKKTGDAIALWANLAVALIISIGIFMYLPLWLSSLVFPKESALAFNLLAGAMRIILFLAYLILISFWKDIRRVFEYHGAEHKAIFTFEDDKELTLDNMRPYTTLHPRCGTSFLLLVGILCILLFSVVDALVITFAGPYPHVAARFAVHLLLIPLVSGVSYEALKISDRYRHVPVVGALILPGLWLQKITTRPPDDSQLETAAAALKAVI